MTWQRSFILTGTTLQRTLIRVQQVVRAVMAIGLLLGATLAFTENAESTLLVVNSLADDNVGSGNVGDLRYVINRANTLQTGTSTTPDLIQFTGITLTQTHHTISVGAGAAGRVPLPALTDAAVMGDHAIAVLREEE